MPLWASVIGVFGGSKTYPESPISQSKRNHSTIQFYSPQRKLCWKAVENPLLAGLGLRLSSGTQFFLPGFCFSGLSPPSGPPQSFLEKNPLMRPWDGILSGVPTIELMPGKERGGGRTAFYPCLLSILFQLHFSNPDMSPLRGLGSN